MVEKVFNELLVPKVKIRVDRSFNQVSIPEQLALLSPFLFTDLVLTYAFMITFDSSMYHLIVNSAALEAVTHNLFVIAGATILEAYAAAFLIINVGFFVLLNCLVMAKCKHILAMGGLHLRFKKIQTLYMEPVKL